MRRDRRVVYHAERNPLADLTEQITMAAPQEHEPDNGEAWPWTRRHCGEMQGGAWHDIVTSAFSAEEQRVTASRGERSPGAWKRDSDQRCDA